MKDLNKVYKELVSTPMSSMVDTASNACGYKVIDGVEFEVQIIVTQNKDFWIGEKRTKKMTPYESKD